MGGGQLVERGRRAGSGGQHLRRPGRSGGGWGDPRHHSARRGQHLQRHGQRLGRERQHAGEQLHAEPERSGPEGAVRPHQAVRHQSHGRRPDCPGPALVLPDLSRRSCRRTRSRACGSTRTPATPTRGRWISIWTGKRSRTRSTGTGSGASRGRRRRATSSLPTGRSSSIPSIPTGAAARRPRLKRVGRSIFQPSHIQQATWSSPRHEPAAARGRHRDLPGPVHGQRRRRAAGRRHLQPADDPGERTGWPDPGPVLPAVRRG